MPASGLGRRPVPEPLAQQHPPARVDQAPELGERGRGVPGGLDLGERVAGAQAQHQVGGSAASPHPDSRTNVTRPAKPAGAGVVPPLAPGRPRLCRGRARSRPAPPRECGASVRPTRSRCRARSAGYSWSAGRRGGRPWPRTRARGRSAGSGSAGVRRQSYGGTVAPAFVFRTWIYGWSGALGDLKVSTAVRTYEVIERIDAFCETLPGAGPEPTSKGRSYSSFPPARAGRITPGPGTARGRASRSPTSVPSAPGSAS